MKYFTAIWYIVWPFGNVVIIWYIFRRFGILCQYKSGSPAVWWRFSRKTYHPVTQRREKSFGLPWMWSPSKRCLKCLDIFYQDLKRFLHMYICAYVCMYFAGARSVRLSFKSLRKIWDRCYDLINLFTPPPKMYQKFGDFNSNYCALARKTP
jgi:hypothetical protein